MRSHDLPNIAPPAEGGWFRKMLLSVAPILLHVFGQRSQQAFDTKHLYLGLEHYWYGPWTCALVLLCDKSKTLVLSPQRWVTKSATESESRRWLIPDFTLIRIIESDKKYETQDPKEPSCSKFQEEPAKPSRRSQRIRELEEAKRIGDSRNKDKASKHSDSEDTSQEGSDSEDEGKPRYKPPMEVPVKCIFQKVGAFVEIKPATDDRSDAAIRRGLTNACQSLMEQISLFFVKKGDNNKKDLAVVGIYAAGHYWSWDIFTPENTWSAKPVSVHKDGTYRPDKEEISKLSFPIVTRPYFMLGHRQSNAEMEKVAKAIYKLPGSEPFGDLH